jgi:hypothetical protein
MLKLFLITAVLLGISMIGIAIKIWGKKDGQFEGTCSSGNIKLRAQGISCGCGKQGPCKNEGKHDHDHDHEDELGQKVFIKSLKR